MHILLILAALAALSASPAYAECKPYHGDDDTVYLEYTRSRYTICYGTTRQHLTDRNIARKWIDNAFRLGREKYKVTSYENRGHELKLTIYLPPEPTGTTRQGYVGFACCYSDRNGEVGRNGETIHHSEIHYLTPSAWVGDSLGGLGQPPEYYHPHYLTHEVMHYIQYVCCRTQARESGYKVPSWITEGMSESDGYRHTTDWSRTTGIDRLNDLFLRSHLGSVLWGRNLKLERDFVVSSVYWGGGFVMNHLAETYGDDIHRELLLDPLPAVLERHNSSVTDLFVDLVVAVRELQEASEDDNMTFSGQRPARDAKPLLAEPACRVDIVEQ